MSRQKELQEREQQPPRRIPQQQTVETVRPELQNIDESVKVRVRAFQFTGAGDLVPESELQSLVREYIGQELGFSGLQEVVAKVTQHLRDKGYLLARAYLPQQDVTEGDIEIAILKGRLDGAAEQGGGWRFNLDDKARISEAYLSRMAESAAPSGSVARSADIERALLLMNDIPAITARARLEPGLQPGTTQIITDVAGGPWLSGNVWVDNYGNYSTGRWEANANISINNPWGWGDRLTLFGSASEGNWMGSARYNFPIGSDGLRGSVSYTNMYYEVVNGPGVTAGLGGQSQILSCELTYPIIRGRTFNLYGDLGYKFKRLQDDSDAGMLRDKLVHAGSYGLRADHIDELFGGGFTQASVSMTVGDLDLSRVPADKAADSATLGTDGGYALLSGYLSRLQNLGGDFTLAGSFYWQYALDNLDSSEQFILGGPGGVRAYPVGEAQGDAGWLATLELRYDVPVKTPLGDVQLKAFVDAGQVSLHHDRGNTPITTATGDNSYYLSGAGLGVDIRKNDTFTFSFVWAHALGDNPGRDVNGRNVDEGDDKDRFWLQCAIRF